MIYKAQKDSIKTNLDSLIAIIGNQADTNPYKDYVTATNLTENSIDIKIGDNEFHLEGKTSLFYGMYFLYTFEVTSKLETSGERKFKKIDEFDIYCDAGNPIFIEPKIAENIVFGTQKIETKLTVMNDFAKDYLQQLHIYIRSKEQSIFNETKKRLNIE